MWQPRRTIVDAAGAELVLVGGDGRRRAFEVPDRRGAAQERDAHPRHEVVAELEVASPVPVVRRGAEPLFTLAGDLLSATTEA